MILGEIRRFVRDNSSLRVSRSLKDLAYKIEGFEKQVEPTCFDNLIYARKPEGFGKQVEPTCFDKRICARKSEG